MQPIAEYVNAHHEAIPRYLSYSFVIQIYALFEELAKKLHRQLMAREGIPGPAKLKSNKFLAQFKEFTENAGITFNRWPALIDFKEVRNNIAHHGGIVAGDTKEHDLTQIVASNSPTLRIDGDQIQVTPEYAVENLNLVKEFFSEALTQKRFEDGYSFSLPTKKLFGLVFDGSKATIEIQGASADETGDLNVQSREFRESPASRCRASRCP
jgi:hypothetical protein